MKRPNLMNHKSFDEILDYLNELERSIAVLSESKAELSRRADEIIDKLEIQNYGQMHHWAGVWITCEKCKTFYGTGGNWGMEEGGPCPFCEARDYLKWRKEGK